MVVKSKDKDSSKGRHRDTKHRNEVFTLLIIFPLGKKVL